jgi:hypothetical protein
MNEGLPVVESVAESTFSWIDHFACKNHQRTQGMSGHVSSDGKSLVVEADSAFLNTRFPSSFKLSARVCEQFQSQGTTRRPPS